MPRSANVEYYARIVKEKSTLRSLIHSANKILTEAYEAEQEPDLLLDEAERAIFAIAEDRIRAGFVPLRDLVQSSFATIEKLQQHKGLVTGVPTGFVDLDEMTSGLQPSDLVLVAARPSMGKTSFVLNIAQHVGTSTDMTVGLFSLEMSKEQLFMRMLTAEARIDAHRFRSGFLSEKDYGRLSHALGTLAEARVFIDDTASIGVLEMRAKARRLKAEHGLHLLIIDYIQLMQGRGRFESRQAELASISRSLKGLAKELNVPIVALSQLSRAPETRSDHRPQLSDLRESGALEQDADVVMFIYREEQYRDDDGQPNQEDAGGRRDHHRQAAQRPHRHRQAGVHQGTHALREPGARIGHDPADRRARRSRRDPRQLSRHRSLSRPRLTGPRRRSSPSSRPTPTAMARRRWRSRSRRPAPRCSRARTSKRPSSCARRACGRRSWCSARLSVSDLDGVFEHGLTPTISTPGAGARACRPPLRPGASRSAATSRSTPA